MKLDTKWPADSVEFCPHPKASNILVCGTYLLCDANEGAASKVDEGGEEVNASASRQRRRGQCIVLDVSDASIQPQMKEELDFSAVLDMKWSYHLPEWEAYLAIAESEGRIVIRRWDVGSCRMEFVQNIQYTDTNTLCLSLDWSNRVNKDPGSLLVSTSNGSLTVLRYNDSGELSPTSTWHAHNYEPWIAAWNYWNTDLCYSGGDDVTLKGWDTRDSSAQPTFTNTKFGGGVTTIQCNPHVDNVVAVGSYDETVRIFDMRKPRTPLSETPVSGGVWRVKWHPSSSRQSDLLTACMHDGFKVIHFLDDWTSAEITSQFHEHTSLAYGVDWYHGSQEDDGKTLVASCSFYDHVLHTWAS